MRQTIYSAIAFALLCLSCAGAITQVTNTIAPTGGDYTSLATWEDAADDSGDLTAGDGTNIWVEISGDWTGTNDPNAVTIDGWTTAADKQINIYTTGEARHAGKWDANKYVLSVANNAYYNAESYTIADGLQIEEVSTLSRTAIAAYGPYETVRNCIARTDASGTTSTAITFGSSANQRGLIYNCIAINRASDGVGIKLPSANGGSNSVFNCTVIHSGSAGANIGISSSDNGTYPSILKNCIVSGFESNNIPNADGASGYNAVTTSSVYALGVDGKTGDLESQSFTFWDAASFDYHLSASDTSVIDAGFDLSVTFANDIDGQTRSGSWDIGADEYIAASTPAAVKRTFRFRR